MPMPRAQSTSTAPIDPARAKLVDAARTAWIGRLIDLSRRNNFLFYRPIPDKLDRSNRPESGSAGATRRQARDW
jgi:hypothetical protein